MSLGSSDRLVAGLLYLEHAFKVSDERVVEQWLESPYWQYSCGETFFQHEFPCNPSSLTRWRQRLGEEGCEWLLTATFELNDFASGGSQPDFHIKTLDGSDLSVLMVRVNFVDNPSQISAPAIPVGIAPAPNSSVASGDVTFSWQPVTGATEYKVSYDISFSPDPDDHVYQSSNYESATSLNCASGTCSMTLPNLQVGDGKWWVRARNATGESADWSNTINFTLTNALVARDTRPLNRTWLAALHSNYAEHFAREDGKVKATLEIIWMTGWAPHESQQKPLRPGSAETRLSEALMTEEEKLPC